MKRILIVDDSESIRELVGYTLETAGYSVEKGCDGVEAIELFNKQPADMVITDLNMPNMDGIQLIREIRKQPQYGTVPILMLTTEQQSKKDEAKAAGATGWIVKPFVQEKLLEIIKKVLR